MPKNQTFVYENSYELVINYIDNVGVYVLDLKINKIGEQDHLPEIEIKYSRELFGKIQDFIVKVPELELSESSCELTDFMYSLETAQEAIIYFKGVLEVLKPKTTFNSDIKTEETKYNG